MVLRIQSSNACVTRLIFSRVSLQLSASYRTLVVTTERSFPRLSTTLFNLWHIILNWSTKVSDHAYPKSFHSRRIIFPKSRMRPFLRKYFHKTWPGLMSKWKNSSWTNTFIPMEKDMESSSIASRIRISITSRSLMVSWTITRRLNVKGRLKWWRIHYFHQWKWMQSSVTKTWKNRSAFRFLN